MAPQLWDPYRILNITARDSNMMHCVGHVDRHDGARCRWRIPSNNFAEVCSILDKMAVTPPDEVTDKILSRLARLSLCEDYHQNQKNRILDEWDEKVDAATKVYKRLEKLKTRCSELIADKEKLLALLKEKVKQGNSEASDDSEAEARVEDISERLGQQLSSERRAFEIYKKDAEAVQKGHAALETILRSKLAEADQVSAQQLKDLKRLMRIEADLVKGKGILESRLDMERKGTELIVKQMGELREDLSAKIEDLQAQLSTERQNLHKLKETTSEAMTQKDLVAQEAESLRSQLTNERRNAQDQHRELKTARGQEAAIREELSNERQLSGQLRSKFVDMRATFSEQLKSGCQFDLREHFSFPEELKTHFGEVETTQALLIRALEGLRSELDAERAKGVQLEQEISTMEEENSALTARLSNEHQNSEQLRKTLSDIETERAALSKETEDGQLQLSYELQKSEKLRKDLVMVETEQTVLCEDIKVLQAQLATTHETAERLECELSTTKGEKLMLTSQLSSEQQESEKFRNGLRQVETEKAALCEERDHSRMQLATERQKIEQLHHEISETKAKEATLSTQLEEQKAIAAAQEAIYSTDRARLLEQIAKLERYSIRIIFRALYGRAKSLVEVTVSWVTGGRWRKRTVGGGDMELDAP
jgi:chromosome segregation ATPase